MLFIKVENIFELSISRVNVLWVPANFAYRTIPGILNDLEFKFFSINLRP